jgi:hypothetical protein
MRKIIKMNTTVHLLEADVEHIVVIKQHNSGSLTADSKMFNYVSVNDEVLLKEYNEKKPEHLKMITHRKVIRKELLAGHKTKLTLQRI